jgi:hypothetical protein
MIVELGRAKAERRNGAATKVESLQELEAKLLKALDQQNQGHTSRRRIIGRRHGSED